MLFLNPWLVVPGQSLGSVQVGANAKTSTKNLGRPQYGDAAMGKYWSTWIGKGGGRLDVYTVRESTGTPNERVTVHLVRATSPRFQLTNGLHPGSPAKRLQQAFPSAKATSSYGSASGRMTLWDDVRKGLAWDVAPSGKVVSLIVHMSGQPLDSSVGPYLASSLQKS